MHLYFVTVNHGLPKFEQFKNLSTLTNEYSNSECYPWALVYSMAFAFMINCAYVLVCTYGGSFTMIMFLFTATTF